MFYFGFFFKHFLFLALCGPLRMGYHDLLIAMHLESHATARYKKSSTPITTGRMSVQLWTCVGYVIWTLLLMYIVLADKWLRTSTSSPWRRVPRTWVCTADPVTRTGSTRSNTPSRTWTPASPSARLCSSPRNRSRAGQSLSTLFWSLLSEFDCIILCLTQIM